MSKLPLWISLFLLPFILSAQKQTPLDIALRYVEQHYDKWSLTENDVAGMLVSDQYPTSHNKLVHIYLVQQYANLPVHNAVLGVHITADGRVAYVTSTFVPQLAEHVNTTQPSLSAQDALRRAAAHLDLVLEEPLRILSSEGKTKVTFDLSGIARTPIRAQLRYQPTPGGQVRLAWDLSINHNASANYWSLRVDAVTGDVLDLGNFTTFCTFDDTSNCFAESSSPHVPLRPVAAALRQEHAPPPPPSADGARYRVFPIPLENPNSGNRQLINSPADPQASPQGWHDIDGQPGAEYTITRGNNVHAFLDPNDTDVSQKNEPDGGASLLFDFPFDPNLEPDQYANAAVTQLFYMNNVMHDLAYAYGMDEPAGNFQQNNYNRGGKGGDPVEANAQDGGSLNNANFSTPADGEKGRMQMYLWRSNRGNLLTVTAPQGAAGSYETSTAEFGPQVGTTPISGRVVEALDNSANPRRACSALVNAAAVSGNIALIERGNCLFEEKAVNAEKAGAIGVIICNVDDNLVNMGGSGTIPDPRIPTVMIKASDCRRIRDFLNQGVQVTLQQQQAGGPNFLDGDFDNGIVAHEYGHGISIRLTGGPSQSTCLFNDEQMGEGWSDFFTLVTTYVPGATGIEPRGIGGYVIGASNRSQGIRRLPYSTDMGINNQTYDDIIATSAPHPLGEVWATVLWDLYWKLVDVYGWDDDLYHGKGGNNLALQLVFDGMKLQNCNPGFIDGRDAIIAADLINNDGANECLIWEVFARRGLGWDASQGSSRDRKDGTPDFATRPDCIKELKIAKTATPLIKPGDNITYTITVTNHKTETATGVFVRDELPEGTSYIGGSTNFVAPPSQDGNALVFELGDLAPGDVVAFSYEVRTDPARRSVRQFFDDMEQGDDRWIFDALEGIDIWEITDQFAFSGKKAWRVPNTVRVDDQTLQLLEPLKVSGAQPVLRFYQRYDTEPVTDGGILEVTTDGGTTWQPVANEQIFKNGYRGRISYNTFSIPFLQGYWGKSKGTGFLDTYVDLSPYQGKDLNFRFRFGAQANFSQDTIGGAGWFIDDVEVMDLYTYQAEACVSSDQGDLTCATVPHRGTAVQTAELTGRNDPQAPGFDIRVYPNPAHDWINVAIRTPRPVEATIELLSLDGRRLRETRSTLAGDEQIIPINTAGLPAGIYLVRMQSQTATLVERVIVE